jgi:hypothetical protein
VLYCYFDTKIAFLWYNVIGALSVVAVALLVNPLVRNRHAQKPTRSLP